jgi:NAD(P)-dependent dehydrogenase (short-subunit alcohol dehydrogenase family)
MDERLNGKTALVTGAGTGIGRAIALLFAIHGARIGVNVHRSVEGGKRTVHEIQEKGGDAVLLPADITSTPQVKAAVERLERSFGGIDILVNNSGTGTSRTPDRVTDIAEDEWDLVLGVNLTGAMITSKFTIPLMKKRGGGCIVNISSIRGLLGNPVLASYCASKGGLVLLTKQMALDYAADGIRVNCLCPGFTQTEMLETYLQKQDNPDAARKMFADMAPLRRIGTPEEIANCALFFASDQSSFITGAALPVDGGYAANGIRKIQ